jgi:hypothetical protein
VAAGHIAAQNWAPQIVAWFLSPFSKERVVNTIERNEQEVSAKKIYVRPQLMKQGRVEDLTQDYLENCISQPTR